MGKGSDGLTFRGWKSDDCPDRGEIRSGVGDDFRNVEEMCFDEAGSSCESDAIEAFRE